MSEISQYPRFEEPDRWSSDPAPAATPTIPLPAMDWEIPAPPGGPGPQVTPDFGPAGPAGPMAPPPRRAAGGVTAVIAALVVTAIVAFLVGGAMSARSTPKAVGVATPTSPSAGSGSSPSVGSGSSSTNDSTATSPGGSSATTASFNGIVDINTVPGYGSGRAAGTGMVLTSSGEVLTNNHVVDGSTKISVTAVDTGRTYTAHVVGTDPTDDVAVIQLEGASKLTTVTTAKLSNVAIGDPVVAVGNAGGKGGTPSSVDGSVTDLGQSITATDESGANAERLTDLIEVDAPIEAGDSGGPLFNSSGEVIGMNSAAQVNASRLRATTSAGYAIPIAKALSIADKIESGKASSTIHIGLPAFLGVQIASAGRGSGSGSGGFGADSGSTATSAGAPVAGVEPGTPAASIGLAAGDTITSVDGQAVDTPSALSTLLRGNHPGDKVSIGWTDAAGTDHTAKATLTTGPAD